MRGGKKLLRSCNKLTMHLSAVPRFHADKLSSPVSFGEQAHTKRCCVWIHCDAAVARYWHRPAQEYNRAGGSGGDVLNVKINAVTDQYKPGVCNPRLKLWTRISHAWRPVGPHITGVPVQLGAVPNSQPIRLTRKTPQRCIWRQLPCEAWMRCVQTQRVSQILHPHVEHLKRGGGVDGQHKNGKAQQHRKWEISTHKS